MLFMYYTIFLPIHDVVVLEVSQFFRIRAFSLYARIRLLKWLTVQKQISNAIVYTDNCYIPSSRTTNFILGWFKLFVYFVTILLLYVYVILYVYYYVYYIPYMLLLYITSYKMSRTQFQTYFQHLVSQLIFNLILQLWRIKIYIYIDENESAVFLCIIHHTHPLYVKLCILISSIIYTGFIRTQPNVICPICSHLLIMFHFTNALPS